MHATSAEKAIEIPVGCVAEVTMVPTTAKHQCCAMTGGILAYFFSSFGVKSQQLIQQFLEPRILNGGPNLEPISEG
jgi:hypothetical protein